MTLRPQPIPSVPAATVAAVQAAFPKGDIRRTTDVLGYDREER
jgi:hypothetical protein